MTPDAERALLQQAAAGNQAARNALALANQGLVHKIARRYYYAGVTGCLEYEDLVQIGNLGLLRAIDKWRFDAGSGRFSTYACLWIRAFIAREGVGRGQDVTISYRDSSYIARARRVRGRLYQKQNHAPTAAEIASESGVPVRVVENFLEMERRPVLRLDSEYDPTDSESSALHEFIPAPRSDTAYEVERHIVSENLMDAIEQLSPDEKTVITRRYLDGETASSVAAEIGRAKATVRNIELRALRKLRSRIS